MSTILPPSKISSIPELADAVAQRAPRFVFASDFKAWPDKTDDFYSFLAPDSRGIHACERVRHPGSSRLAEFENLCALILGGSEVVIELTPDCQQAVCFCEMLLATLYEDLEAQKVSDPFVNALVKTTDWSVQDRSGPRALPTPTAVGFTDSKNLKRYQTEKSAVIWSKHWQLSIDPVNSLLKRVGQIIEERNRALKPSKSKTNMPPAVDLWVDQTLVGLQLWIEDRLKLPTIALEELSHDQLPALPFEERLEKEQVEYICDKLTQRFYERDLQSEWCIMMRSPAALMYEMAGRSFAPEDNVLKDYWGYPFAFDLAFGSGVVKVRCEGLTALNEPDVAVSTVTTPEQQLAIVEERPDDLLTIAEAAKYANVSTRTIRSWLGAKQANDKPMLPGVVRTDRIVNIPRGDLEPWRKKQKSKRKYTGSRSKKKKA